MEFTAAGRLLMYIIKTKGFKTDPWGRLWFTVP
jgi:hypothetical protein